MTPLHFDILVVGSGPAGLAAAIEGARHGARVCIVEKERDLGGACVHRGTIPSKTLREAAVQLARLKRNPIGAPFSLDGQTEVAALMSRLDEVVTGHVTYMTRQIEESGARHVRGRARFVGPRSVVVERVRAEPLALTADVIIVAVGSQPRTPKEVPVDHENVLDSDSILSMIYVPESLTVLGGGVIACEWASIFAELGVRVTLVDRGARPLSFLDPELGDRFVRSLTNAGSVHLARRDVVSVEFDGASEVKTTLASGEVVRSRKLLCALGRVACLDGLGVEALGLAPTARGLLAVDEHGQTSVPHVYAVGDVVGFPALAATSMDQGRRAVRHALGVAAGRVAARIPIGIFTIPELSAVGVTEAEAREAHGDVLVGRARFDEVARGHISGIKDGFLKLVAHAETRELLGAHIAGEGATELIGIAQVALAARMTVDDLVENIFNFPTLAEAYRIAALDVVRQHERRASPQDQRKFCTLQTLPLGMV